MGYIKLNQKAFFHNLEYFSKICGKEKLSIALKDNAYGHGIEQIASMANDFGIKHVFVRNLQEAAIAKKYDFETILVLYDIPQNFDERVILSVNSLAFLEKIPTHSKVELKIDTGMNRNGISKEEIAQAMKIIKENQLQLFGVFTHFCCSDESNGITKEQENQFQEAIVETKKYTQIPFRTHCANSAGVFKVDMDRYDIARVGLGIYGYLDIPQIEKELQPVLSLYAQKIATKNIKKNQHIGYGSDGFIAPCDMVVSNYDIGYGDGLFRANSEKIRKIANGLEILGRVSMDSFSVESCDEEVCVFDDVTHFAQIHNTIKYEILTSLKPSILRDIF